VGELLEAVGWLVREHPGVAAMLAMTLVGLGGYGNHLQAMKLVPKWVPLVVLPVAAVWLLARKSKDGRRGIAIVGPWAIAIGGALLWWLAPELRWRIATPIVAAGLVYAIVSIDAWLGVDPGTGRNRRWTRQAFRDAFDRDEATLAFHAGISVALGGRHGKVGKVTTGPDGRSRVTGKVPSGAKVPDVAAAAKDGRFGAAANHYGMGVTDVEVVAGHEAGTYTVVGTVLGQHSPLDDEHPFPTDGLGLEEDPTP
jgi:hypothetical protein